MDEAEMTSLNNLKIALVNPPVLSLASSDLPYILETDACNKQLGYVLMQRYSEKSLPQISYFSQTLTDAEKNYDTTESDCLAIFWEALLLCPFLFRNHFEIQTDQDSLKWLLDFFDATGKRASWRVRLQEYDGEVVFQQ